MLYHNKADGEQYHTDDANGAKAAYIAMSVAIGAVDLPTDILGSSKLLRPC
jgi:hypothetical protein